MRMMVYSARAYDESTLERANAGAHTLTYVPVKLDTTTVGLASGYEAVCCFVNDVLSADVLALLAAGGTRLVTLRCTGYNNLDLAAAQRHGITAMRVSSYSPYSVAEFAVGLLQTLNRRIHRAYTRNREFAFVLDGFMGRDLHGQTVGVVGTGKIGAIFAGIMRGFGCDVLAYDVVQNEACLAQGVRYTGLDDLIASSDIISLHVPLFPETKYLIDATSLARMRPRALLINTSRGGLVDTAALIDALQRGAIGGVALDVYEDEAGVFFNDLSGTTARDASLSVLMSFPNVLVTSHQAFFTEEAMATIAETTIGNLTDFATGRDNANKIM